MYIICYHGIYMKVIEVYRYFKRIIIDDLDVSLFFSSITIYLVNFEIHWQATLSKLTVLINTSTSLLPITSVFTST